MPEKECPCAAVIELKETTKELRRIIENHEHRLAEGNTNFALIDQKLNYICTNMQDKKKFNASIILATITTVISIVLGLIVAWLKLGV